MQFQYVNSFFICLDFQISKIYELFRVIFFRFWFLGFHNDFSQNNVFLASKLLQIHYKKLIVLWRRKFAFFLWNYIFIHQIIKFHEWDELDVSLYLINLENCYMHYTTNFYFKSLNLTAQWVKWNRFEV